jgi:RNA polymerase sigma-B factor
MMCDTAEGQRAGSTFTPEDLQERRRRRARDELIVRFLPLAYRLARQYRASREPDDDLVQIASLGLVKAAHRYDPDRGTAFVTFAIPTIRGELNRYLRDSTWPLHVDRRAQSLARETAAAQREVTAALGRGPNVSELAAYLGCSSDTIVDGLLAAAARETVPLDAPTSTQEPDAPTRLDRLGCDDQLLERLPDSATVFAAARNLTRRERLVLYLRFGEDLSQTEIAKRVGVSQMHVSRIIRDSLERLRELAGASEAA